MRLIVGLFIVALGWAPPAFGQDLSSVLSSSGFTESQKGELTAEVAHDSAVGIPSSMLVPRIQEGIAKGIGFQRILAVVRRTSALLVQARGMLLGSSAGSRLIDDRSAWSLAAALIDSGVDPAAIEGIARASGGNGSSFRHASVLYTALVEWGVSAARSLALAESVQSSRLGPRDYSAIVDLFALGRSRSIQADRMAERILGAFRDAKDFTDLKRRVLY